MGALFRSQKLARRQKKLVICKKYYNLIKNYRIEFVQSQKIENLINSQPHISIPKCTHQIKIGVTISQIKQIGLSLQHPSAPESCGLAASPIRTNEILQSLHKTLATYPSNQACRCPSFSAHTVKRSAALRRDSGCTLAPARSAKKEAELAR